MGDERGCPGSESRDELSSVHGDVIPHRGIPVAAALILASMLGVYIRLELLSLHDFPGAIVPPLIYPEGVGCLQIGFATVMKDTLIRKYLPFYIGLTTGVAGSVTTFSSWSLLLFRTYAVSTLAPGRIAQTTLAQLILGFSVSLAGLVFGRHLATALTHLCRRRKRAPGDHNTSWNVDWTSTLRRNLPLFPFSGPAGATSDNTRDVMVDEATALDEASTTPVENGMQSASAGPSLQAPTLTPDRRMLYRIAPETWSLSDLDARDWTVTCLAIATWALAFFGATVLDGGSENSAKRLLWCSVFGPAGTLLRWRLSRLNLGRPNFPLGTFAANIMGSAILAGLYAASRWREAGDASSNRLACLTLIGMMDGFCACLTTVSTFVTELFSLHTNHAYFYAFASVLGAQVCTIVIAGLPLWNGRLADINQQGMCS